MFVVQRSVNVSDARDKIVPGPGSVDAGKNFGVEGLPIEDRMVERILLYGRKDLLHELLQGVAGGLRAGIHGWYVASSPESQVFGSIGGIRLRETGESFDPLSSKKPINTRSTGFL